MAHRSCCALFQKVLGNGLCATWVLPAYRKTLTDAANPLCLNMRVPAVLEPIAQHLQGDYAQQLVILPASWVVLHSPSRWLLLWSRPLGALTCMCTMHKAITHDVLHYMKAVWKTSCNDKSHLHLIVIELPAGSLLCCGIHLTAETCLLSCCMQSIHSLHYFCRISLLLHYGHYHHLQQAV